MICRTTMTLLLFRLLCLNGEKHASNFTSEKNEHPNALCVPADNVSISECEDNATVYENNHILLKRHSEAQDIEEILDENNGDLFNDTDYYNGSISEEEYMEKILQFIYPKTWTWVLIAFNSVVFVIGMVGNTLVCVAVYRNHTMRTVTNYFIVNLALADFLVILLCLPPTVVWDVTMTWFFGTAMCKIVLYLQSVSVTVSVLTLTFISIDRWYAICFPLKFKSTTSRAKTAIGIIWLLALALDIPEAISLRTFPSVELEFETIYFTQCRPAWSEDMDTIFLIIRMTLLYAIPLLFMTIAYIQIISVLWKSGNSSNQSLDISGTRHGNTFAMNMNASTEGQIRSRRKAAKMLVAVVVMFGFCYFPVHFLSLLRLIMTLKNSEGNRAISMISHWLCYANSAVNPIIYNFMSGKFRKEFRRAFEHSCQRSNEEGIGRPLRAYRDKDSRTISRTLSWKTQGGSTRTSSLHWEERKEFLGRRGTKCSATDV